MLEDCVDAILQHGWVLEDLVGNATGCVSIVNRSWRLSGCHRWMLDHVLDVIDWDLECAWINAEQSGSVEQNSVWNLRPFSQNLNAKSSA